MSIGSIGGGSPLPPDMTPGAALATRVQDCGLKAVLTEVMADGNLNEEDARTLVRSAEDEGGLSASERQDIFTILNRASLRMDPGAQAVLESYLGFPSSMPSDPVTPASAAPTAPAMPSAADVWSSIGGQPPG